MPNERSDDIVPPRLRCAVVLRVNELECDAWAGGNVESIRFAPLFPTPRTERVSPGHLVAVATAATGSQVIVWRWYDAVVLGPGASGLVQLWEPAHGEVTARPRASHRRQEPASRAYASAGLPGADWWIAGPVVARPEDAAVDIDEVEVMFTANRLWTAAFGPAA